MHCVRCNASCCVENIVRPANDITNLLPDAVSWEAGSQASGRRQVLCTAVLKPLVACRAEHTLSLLPSLSTCAVRCHRDAIRADVIAACDAGHPDSFSFCPLSLGTGCSAASLPVSIAAVAAAVNLGSVYRPGLRKSDTGSARAAQRATGVFGDIRVDIEPSVRANGARFRKDSVLFA